MHYRATALFDILRDEGRTQVWLAGKMGYSRAYLSTLKTTGQPVTRKFALAASRALGRPIEDLFLPADVPQGTINEPERTAA